MDLGRDILKKINIIKLKQCVDAFIGFQVHENQIHTCVCVARIDKEIERCFRYSF